MLCGKAIVAPALSVLGQVSELQAEGEVWFDGRHHCLASNPHLPTKLTHKCCKPTAAVSEF